MGKDRRKEYAGLRKAQKIVKQSWRLEEKAKTFTAHCKPVHRKAPICLSAKKARAKSLCQTRLTATQKAMWHCDGLS